MNSHTRRIGLGLLALLLLTISSSMVALILTYPLVCFSILVLPIAYLIGYILDYDLRD